MALQFQANWNVSFKPSTWPPNKTHFHNPKNPLQTSLFSKKPRSFSDMNLRSLSQLKSPPTHHHRSRKPELSASAVAAKDAIVDDKSAVEDTDTEVFITLSLFFCLLLIFRCKFGFICQAKYCISVYISFFLMGTQKICSFLVHSQFSSNGHFKILSSFYFIYY